ncbi:MAG: hypothetical protein RL043_1157, partial [Pseudomonadota bacterium]
SVAQLQLPSSLTIPPDQGVALPLGLQNPKAGEPVQRVPMGPEDKVLAIVDRRFQCWVAGVLPEQAFGPPTDRRSCLEQMDLRTGLTQPIRETAGRSEPSPTTANNGDLPR